MDGYGKLTIENVEYDTREQMLRQSDLEFYQENPRVFSILNTAESMPDQHLIEETMRKMPHVRQLAKSIRENGGLIDPIIVRNRVVLEGNSRLAAYRILFDEDPIEWAYIKCTVLPDNFPESAIFTLLGQYHVSGKTNWSPFEQGGFLVRQIDASNRSIEDIASSLGLPTDKAKKYVETYRFMSDNHDLSPRNWSYYEEYLKSRGIKKYRDTSSDIDHVFVDMVKTGEIVAARDVRDVLGEIAKSTSRESKKIMQDIISGDMTIYDGFDQLEDTGKIGNCYKVLNTFHKKIRDQKFEKMLADEDLKQIDYQLKQIEKQISKLRGKIKDSGNL